MMQLGGVRRGWRNRTGAMERSSDQRARSVESSMSLSYPLHSCCRKLSKFSADLLFFSADRLYLSPTHTLAGRVKTGEDFKDVRVQESYAEVEQALGRQVGQALPKTTQTAPKTDQASSR
eukprot:768543-Hanusia_phi.AAC.8